MEEIRLMPVGSNLDVERALSAPERRRLLDAADLLISVDGKSKDRRRNKVAPVERPSRASARPWRNRTIIYCLIETGMRRAAVVNLNLGGAAPARPQKRGYSVQYARVSNKEMLDVLNDRT